VYTPQDPDFMNMDPPHCCLPSKLDIENCPRSSKRSRVPPAVYTPQDPEMEQIIKSIKKQEEEEKKEREAKIDNKVETF
jgi:hypothetical protein